MKIWQADQEYLRTRWTVTTFFMSVSFAIFGFSFQAKLAPIDSLTLHIAGLMIYWFAIVMHLHFLQYSKFLRSYLLDMEKSGRTSLDIQGKTGLEIPPNTSKWLSTMHLFFYFGALYTVGVVLLWLLSL